MIVPAISLGGHGSFIISAAVRRDTKRSFCLSLLPLETFCKWHKKTDALVSLAAHRRPRHWWYDRAGATTLKPTVHTNAVKTSYLRVVVRSVEKNNSSSTFSGCPLETASKQFHVETITITPFWAFWNPLSVNRLTLISQQSSMPIFQIIMLRLMVGLFACLVRLSERVFPLLPWVRF